MRDYLTSEEYLQMTNELKEIVERKREPTSTYDFAFGYAYDGCMTNEPFLRIYAEYLLKNPKASVKDLHALCLGYGTAGSVIDALAEQDEQNKKDTYH